jgi:four helix bundle protein
MRPQELEDRLIDFAVVVVGVAESLPSTRAGNPFAGQLIRSGTSPAPNYGEARSAGSRKDFIHKMKIALKELRETMIWLKMIWLKMIWLKMIWLKMISRKSMVGAEGAAAAVSECGELIAIFVSSTRTAVDGRIPNQKSTIVIHQSSIRPEDGSGAPDRKSGAPERKCGMLDKRVVGPGKPVVVPVE